MAYLSTRTRTSDDEPAPRWAEPFLVGFVLLAITYVNIVKNVLVDPWIANQVVPAGMYGIPAWGWFNLAYLALAAVVVAAILRHRRTPLPVLPATALGRAQAFFVVFLWWIVIGNLSRYLPFHPVRLVTEGVIHLNACAVTALVLLWPVEADAAPVLAAPSYAQLMRRVAFAGLALLVVCSLLYTAAVLPLSDGPAGGARFRFGPRSLEGF